MKPALHLVREQSPTALAASSAAAAREHADAAVAYLIASLAETCRVADETLTLDANVIGFGRWERIRHAANLLAVELRQIEAYG